MPVEHLRRRAERNAVLVDWLLHFFGVLPRTPSSAYNWWSGAGSDLGEAAIVGGLLHMAKTANCHVQGCWRIGNHPVEGTPYKTCSKHHPQTPDRITVEHIHRAHYEAAHPAAPRQAYEPKAAKKAVKRAGEPTG